MKKSVLTIGGSMLDIFLKYHHELLPCMHDKEKKASYLLLEVGRKLELSSIEKYTGGGATNAAVSFARLGFTTNTFCKVGKDCEGKYIIDILQKEGVITDNIVTTPDTGTGTSIIIPCPKGDRTVLLHRGASLLLKQQELSEKQFESSDYIYVTSLSHEAAQLLTHITKLAQKYAKKIAINPGSSQMIGHADTVRDALPIIDILILNSFETKICMASLMQKTETITAANSSPKKTYCEEPPLLMDPLCYQHIRFMLRDYFKHMLTLGPHIIVVTDGANGVYVATENTILYHPSIPTQVVSTLGAGDAFGSCFIASLAQGKTIQEALVRGIVNATSVIEHLDTKTGLLNSEQLEERVTRVRLNRIQTFDL